MQALSPLRCLLVIYSRTLTTRSVYVHLRSERKGKRETNQVRQRDDEPTRRAGVFSRARHIVLSRPVRSRFALLSSLPRLGMMFGATATAHARSAEDTRVAGLKTTHAAQRYGWKHARCCRGCQVISATPLLVRRHAVLVMRGFSLTASSRGSAGVVSGVGCLFLALWSWRGKPEGYRKGQGQSNKKRD